MRLEPYRQQAAASNLPIWIGATPLCRLPWPRILVNPGSNDFGIAFILIHLCISRPVVFGFSGNVCPRVETTQDTGFRSSGPCYHGKLATSRSRPISLVHTWIAKSLTQYISPTGQHRHRATSQAIQYVASAFDLSAHSVGQYTHGHKTPRYLIHSMRHSSSPHS